MQGMERLCMHVSRLQVIQKMPQALACVQNALDELKQFQREQSGSTGEPSRLLLPDLSSAATSERHDSTVVPYNQRLQQLEGDWKLRGLVASQVNTACATPNVAVLGEGGADEDSAIDEQVSLFIEAPRLGSSTQSVQAPQRCRKQSGCKSSLYAQSTVLHAAQFQLVKSVLGYCRRVLPSSFTTTVLQGVYAAS